jgi:hypothetical protein
LTPTVKIDVSFSGSKVPRNVKRGSIGVGGKRCDRKEGMNMEESTFVGKMVGTIREKPKTWHL